MLQQAFIQHIVALQLDPKVMDSEIADICGLTRLTFLSLVIGAAPTHEGALVDLTFLQKLCELSLSGAMPDGGIFRDLGALELSPLSQLTKLSLMTLRGICNVACTVPSLEHLALEDINIRPPHSVVSKAYRLTRSQYTSGLFAE